MPNGLSRVELPQSRRPASGRVGKIALASLDVMAIGPRPVSAFVVGGAAGLAILPDVRRYRRQR